MRAHFTVKEPRAGPRGGGVYVQPSQFSTPPSPAGGLLITYISIT